MSYFNGLSTLRRGTLRRKHSVVIIYRRWEFNNGVIYYYTLKTKKQKRLDQMQPIEKGLWAGNSAALCGDSDAAEQLWLCLWYWHHLNPKGCALMLTKALCWGINHARACVHTHSQSNICNAYMDSPLLSVTSHKKLSLTGSKMKRANTQDIINTVQTRRQDGWQSMVGTWLSQAHMGISIFYAF